MDAKLAFDAMDFDLRTGLRDEHRKAAAVTRARLGARQNQQNFRIAVRDEMLHAVQPPDVRIIRILRRGCFDGLQIAAVFRLRQSHRAIIFTGREFRKIFLFLLFRTEFLDCLRDALQAEQILQRSVRAGDDLRHHRIDGYRIIQSIVTLCKRDAAEAGGLDVLQVLNSPLRHRHDAVFAMRAFHIDVHRTQCDLIARHFADGLKSGLVLRNHFRRRPLVLAFAQGRDLRKVKLFEVIDQIVVIRIEIHFRLVSLVFYWQLLLLFFLFFGIEDGAA